jgi:hypothetical protein
MVFVSVPLSCLKKKANSLFPKFEDTKSTGEKVNGGEMISAPLMICLRRIKFLLRLDSSAPSCGWLWQTREESMLEHKLVLQRCA